MARKAYSDEERAQVKEVLMVTAIQCIVNRGLIHSSIDVLCKKVGISKTFFYTFFPSKEELVLEALRYQQPKLLQYARQLMGDPSLSWREGVEAFLKNCCYVELDTYFKNVWDYAHQRIAAEQLREVQEYLRSQIPWKSLSSQRMDLGAELLNFWCGEDELDWGYSQYFEIAAGNLKPFLAMTLFTEILCKHFPDVMSAPVKRLSSKL